MSETFVSFYFSQIIVWIEWIAFILSIFSYFSYRTKPGLVISLTLGSIIVAEFAAISQAITSQKNDTVYSILLPFWFIGYLTFFYLSLNSKRSKKIVIVLIGLFIASFIYSPILVSAKMWVPTIPFITGSLGLVFASILALIQISKIPNQHHLAIDPLFWKSCAMMVYFFPTSILMGAFSFFFGWAPTEFGNAFWDSQKILNVLHYSLLSIGFLCRYILSKNSKNDQ